MYKNNQNLLTDTINLGKMMLEENALKQKPVLNKNQCQTIEKSIAMMEQITMDDCQSEFSNDIIYIVYRSWCDIAYRVIETQNTLPKVQVSTLYGTLGGVNRD